MIILSNQSKKILKSCRVFNISKIFEVAKIYKNYPTYYLPATWFLILISQIPLYFITKFFGTSSAGYYALASSMLNIPIILFSNSASAVFIQKASLFYPNKIEKLKSITLELIYFLIVVSSLAFSLVFGFGDLIFKILLGDNWINAGIFARILSIGSVFYFVALPISTLFRILKKEKQFLFLNMSFVVIIVISFFATINSSIEWILLLYSVEYAVYSIIILIYFTRILSIKNPFILIIKFISIVLLIFSISYLLRLLINIL